MTSRHMASGQLPPRRSCTGDDRDGARRGFALGRGDSGGVGFRPCGCRGGRSHDEPTCSRSSDRPIEAELAYKVSLASLSQINAKPLFPSPLRTRGLLPARWTPHSAGSGWFSNSKGPAGAKRRVPLCRSAAERHQRSGSAPAPDRQDGRIRHDACRHARLHRRSRHHTPTGYR